MESIQMGEDAVLEIHHHAVTCTKEQFDEMWTHCPTKKHTFMMRGKLCTMQRFQQMYGVESYAFSRIKLEPDPNIPELVQRCIDFANANDPDHEYNGALCNFYFDSKDYIGEHSDDEDDMLPGAPIFSFSFQFGPVRNFRIRNKATKVYRDFACDHEICLVMSGTRFQKDFTHQVPIIAKSKGPRINVTVRAMRKKTTTKKMCMSDDV